MYAYTIEDFGSSRFTECISITIHRTVFSALLFTDTKMVNQSFMKMSLPPAPSFFFTSQLFIYLPLAYDPQALSGQTHVPNIE